VDVCELVNVLLGDVVGVAKRHVRVEAEKLES
jgi:hypothetical protein